jgi:hypothetical protein
MITIKASQKLFTYAEVGHLTGICADHLEKFARRRHLGFIARAAETTQSQTDRWLFTPWDLAVLVTLFKRCAH